MSRPLSSIPFSERLRVSKCLVCGPGLGKMARAIPVLGSEMRTHVVPVLCRYCGGYSEAFREESTPPDFEIFPKSAVQFWAALEIKSKEIL